jgi:hypothetical protein
MKTCFSDISNKEFAISERVSGKTVRQSILEIIQIDTPQFSTEKF